jgi:uncharacterized membrane protein YccC
MAYTFTDHYRPIRIVLRIDGIVVGIGLGLLMLIYPTELLASFGFAVSGPTWTARLSGSSLLGLGVGLILAANEPEVRMGSLLAAIISNGLIALTLMVAYLQGELGNLRFWGYTILLVVFVVCLLTAVLPIPYVRGIHRVE